MRVDLCFESLSQIGFTPLIKARRMVVKHSTVSISDVAKHAAVSIGTVSRVINQHPSVAAELRRKVMQSSRTLGFRPKVAHRCVAIVGGRQSPALPVGFVSVMTSLIAQHLASRRVLVEFIDIESLSLAYEHHLDGVIGVVFDDRLAELHENLQLPVFTINKPMADRGIHSVYSDHYQQGRMATDLLIRHGHRRIAFLAIQADEWGSSERRRGYEDALRDHGIEPDESLCGYSKASTTRDLLTRWHDAHVTGLLNFSEDAGMEVFHLLTHVMGLSIGQDISTITLEDLPIYQHLSPPQTVVRQPLASMAEIVVDALLQRIEFPNTPGVMDHRLATDLVERESVGPAPVFA